MKWRRSVLGALCAPLLWVGCASAPAPPTDADLPPPVASADSSKPPGRPPDGQYFHTEDTDAWVAKNFVFQERYAHVRLVGEPRAEEIEVAPPSTERGAPIKVRVDGHYATIQEAVNASGPGDLVAVQPGVYAGFTLGAVEGAGPRAFTFVRGLGPKGSVVIDRPGSDRLWMIYLRGAHHVVVEGLRVRGAGERTGPRAGIMLDGDFGRTGRLLRNVAIVGVLSERHRTWGMHATDTATVLVQDSAFTGSVEEHGLYVSDGSDDWVIRRNVFFSNYACGLQINLDPLASLEETVKHVGMLGMRPMAPSRAWARDALERADREYGANNYPDGIGKNFVIEGNVSNANGERGGAAYNFAALTESIIQRNLAYDNLAGGLVLWDNANPFDAELVSEQPRSPEGYGEEQRPLFGSRDNLVRFNTFVDAKSPRAAIQCRNGSTGLRLYGNIAVHGRGPGMWITPDSIPGLDAVGNVMGPIEIDPSAPAMTKLARKMPSVSSKVGVPLEEVLASMISPTHKPWAVVAPFHPEKPAFFELAPDRPDYRARPGAPLLAPFADQPALGASWSKR